VASEAPSPTAPEATQAAAAAPAAAAAATQTAKSVVADAKPTQKREVSAQPK